MNPDERRQGWQVRAATDRANRPIPRTIRTDTKSLRVVLAVAFRASTTGQVRSRKILPTSLVDRCPQPGGFDFECVGSEVRLATTPPRRDSFRCWVRSTQPPGRGVNVRSLHDLPVLEQQR